MAKFDNGVMYYTFASTEFQVCFPEDEVCCKWCTFLRHYDSLDRDRCALTEEILYSRKLRGQHCPLVVINSVNTEEIDK